ncbi:MAG: hemerythrin domain-containing protein [Myxococcaceae bacterium]
MNAITLLKEQHTEVKHLFKEFEKTDSEQKQRQLFLQIADALAAHAEIEEKIFYPAAFAGGDEQLQAQLKEAVEEHLGVKRLIADLLEMEPGEEQFCAKMTVMHELVKHHIEEEEEELLPKVKKARDRKDLEALGQRMKQQFDQLMEQEPRNEVPGQTDEAASLSQ